MYASGEAKGEGSRGAIRSAPGNRCEYRGARFALQLAGLPFWQRDGRRKQFQISARDPFFGGCHRFSFQFECSPGKYNEPMQ